MPDAMDLESCAVPYEMRLARDGHAYKEHEFQEFYHHSWLRYWNEAAVLPFFREVPRGLRLDKVEKSLVWRALDELMPHFPSKEERSSRPSRSAVEISWTYEGSSYDWSRSDRPRAVAGKPLAQFPHVRRLVSEVMHRLDHRLALDEKQLNISCLLYSPGQCIPWHADRKHIYRDPVFGCVLFNTSDSSLEFHALDRAGEGRPVARYVVPEEVGCCFLQQGEARYDWLHGVPKLSQGERLSVTWRWFLDDVELR